MCVVVKFTICLQCRVSSDLFTANTCMWIFLNFHAEPYLFTRVAAGAPYRYAGLADRTGTHAQGFPHLPLKGRVVRNFPFTVTLYIVHVIWYKISSWCLPYHCNIQPPAARVFRKFNLLLVHSIQDVFFTCFLLGSVLAYRDFWVWSYLRYTIQLQHNPTLLTWQLSALTVFVIATPQYLSELSHPALLLSHPL